MALFAKKKPPEPAAADEQKISLALTPDEIDLLRECMKRTEDYYRGLLLLKQDWNAAQNEAAIAMIKVRLNMIVTCRKRRSTTASPSITAICNKKLPAGTQNSCGQFAIISG